MDIIKKIKLDFYDNQIITVDAKQYDESSRYIQVSCYADGARFYVDKDYNSAFVRCRKPDEYSMFNSCSITDDGDILVELSPQMLVTAGLSLTDIVIIDQSNTEPPIITDEGEIQITDNGSIISTMRFYLNVLPAPFEYEEIESSSEFQGLNDLIDRVTQDYTVVIEEAKSYAEEAEGWAHGRDDMPERAEDNSMYYSQQAKSSLDSINTLEQTIAGYKDEIDQDRATVAADKQNVADMKNSVAADKEEISEMKTAIDSTVTEINQDMETIEGYIDTLDDYKNQIEQDKNTINSAISSAQTAAKEAEAAATTAQSAATQTTSDLQAVAQIKNDIDVLTLYCRGEIVSEEEPTVQQNEGDHWIQPY